MQAYLLMRILVIATVLVCAVLLCTAAKAMHKAWVRLAHKGGKER